MDPIGEYYGTRVVSFYPDADLKAAISAGTILQHDHIKFSNAAGWTVSLPSEDGLVNGRLEGWETEVPDLVTVRMLSYNTNQNSICKPPTGDILEYDYTGALSIGDSVVFTDTARQVKRAPSKAIAVDVDVEVESSGADFANAVYSATASATATESGDGFGRVLYIDVANQKCWILH